MRLNLGNHKGKLWFTSDQHYFHKNILKYTVREGFDDSGKLRPYPTVMDMCEGLIKNHNLIVDDRDIVCHLGDFSWTSIQHTNNILRRLKGTNILVAGNHDMKSIVKCDWNAVHYYLEIMYHGQHLVLFHYPIEEWNGKQRGSIHLRGHSHKDLETDGPSRIEVGVDGSLGKGFPINFDSICEEVNRRREKLGRLC